MKNKTKGNKSQANSVANTLLFNKLSFEATEAYKLLRTNLMFTLTDVKKCKVVGVTSSLRGEGKSTTAINLSYALAETGKKVLIIDCDLRLPSVAKKMEIKSVPGVSNILVGNASEEDAIRIWDKLGNWNILPSGDIPPNPTEMLASAQMEKFLDKLSESYDFIIVDLPPVNLVSDALVISHLLDGMVVVVREGYSERRQLSRCIKQLELSGVKILGIVMNVTGSTADNYGSYRKKRRNKYMKNYYKAPVDSEETGNSDDGNGTAV